jgi:DNA-directed RNA polymerase subunit beta'
MVKSAIEQKDFDSIILKVASPEQIKSWSSGEVVKPETINYRTQKPELDGLFCERIFGPTKNWECYCGKYKRVRYKGVVCEKCGVEVTTSQVRRSRMGHISLAVPTAHIWFLRSVPSRIGLLLDTPIKQLEAVISFAAYIVTDIDEKARDEALISLEESYKKYRKETEDETKKELQKLKAAARDDAKKLKQVDNFRQSSAEKMDELSATFADAKKQIESLQKGKVLSEMEYRDLSMKFGYVFSAGTGAESVHAILEKMDLEKEIATLQKEKDAATGQKQAKLTKRFQLITSLNRAEIRPEWFILKEIPVIPPDLRPMVQLDGGRFAASDLNDLYRRIINRNNRLKRLLAIGAPEVICRNEKRMLQEAVDTLINNSPRAGRTVFSTGDRRKLRSLSDMLKGKQGRFRQNLLGKRVDYSGRSVIVVGPHLKLHQCGLPKKMAMKLFKPFVVGKLIQREFAFNVKGAEKQISAGERFVWDILEEVIQNKYVLLNRAPTLHRLGIQAFQPILVEGKAIQVHPLVCAAFNADFDGDQMAVHLPLSDEAQKEAKEIICANTNLLKPSSGLPIISPTLDMVLGCYFLTQSHGGKTGEGMVFADANEALFAWKSEFVHLQAKVKVRVDGQIFDTTVGRVIFNQILPDGYPFVNKAMRKSDLGNLLSEIFDKFNHETAVKLADEIKDLGFHYATKSGITIGAKDLEIPESKTKIIEDANEKVRKINNQFWRGFLTDEERYIHTVQIWAGTKNEITKEMVTHLSRNPENNVFYTVDSGARGNWGQVTQICGMKGLVASPSGRTIELPIKSNLKEGFTILEYFIATHGGRKGKSDTALKTAQAGYLTRRLVDAVQDIVIKENDCGAYGISNSLPREIKIERILKNESDEEITSFGLEETLPSAKWKAIDPGDISVFQQSGKKVELAFLEKIAPGATKKISYKVSLPDGVETGQFKISGKIKFRVGSGKEQIIKDVTEIGSDSNSKVSAPPHEVSRTESEEIGEKFEVRIFGRTLAKDLVDEKTGEVLAKKDEVIDKKILSEIATRQIEKVFVRSVMTCQTENGICQKCYGFDLGSNKLVEIGTPVGIIAAQSIGEPGTQLTMRTFHMGGVANEGDITQGLTRVEELFEARAPKSPATLSELSGTVNIEQNGEEVIVSVFADVGEKDVYKLEKNAHVAVEEGNEIKSNQILAKGTKILRAKNSGKIEKVTDSEIVIAQAAGTAKTYTFPLGENLIVENKQRIEAGAPLNNGHFNLRDLFERAGTYPVQKYLMHEVQKIYASQGQTINDKHIEIIVKQMFSKVRIIDPGDLKLLPGEVIDLQKVKKLNEKAKNPATYDRMLLGLTRIALATDSWLSAASFQETIRVLVEASTTGKIDKLEGLKENVIIGRLIPAGKIYREKFAVEK